MKAGNGARVAAGGGCGGGHRAPLPQSFFDRDPAIVARELLGAILEHRTREGTTGGRIVETEAYLGPHDPACHAAAGLTRRTKPLHGPPGTAYVYFIYGMHWCMNAVTREEGFGSAVLIRALEPLRGVGLMSDRRGTEDRYLLASGPGRLCKALAIDGTSNGARLDRIRDRLRLLMGWPLPDSAVAVSPRIGVARAVDWPLRFFEAGSGFVSGGRKSRSGGRR
ncbi:MAG: DNA-3-methyladenine glycosylase [Gemmatimonadota bacterium]